MDKFEAAKILAMAAGYKYAASAISPAEQELFDRSYEEWKQLLDSMAAQYARWNKSTDREIAYLIHRNILTITDVGRFISKTGNTETVTTLTRQEAIVFMVRLDGKQANAAAVSLPFHTPFRDDALIRADYKKYVYYAKESGLAVGSDGFINPNRPFTRAEMAQMFYNMLAHKPEAPSPPIPANAAVDGVVEYVFLDSHIFINTGGQPRMFTFDGDAVIMVDNIQRSVGHIRPGMTVTFLANTANEIQSLAARSAPIPAPVSVPSPTPVPASVFRNTAVGWLEEIRLTQDMQQLVIRKDDDTAANYTLVQNTYDIFTLRIGMQLRLYLDNWEIYGIDILSR
jgi:hypothetical protein